jgi:hypothetical protein
LQEKALEAESLGSVTKSHIFSFKQATGLSNKEGIETASVKFWQKSAIAACCRNLPIYHHLSSSIPISPTGNHPTHLEPRDAARPSSLLPGAAAQLRGTEAQPLETWRTKLIQ